MAELRRTHVAVGVTANFSVLQQVRFLLFDLLVMNTEKASEAAETPLRPAPLDRMYRFVDFAAHYQKGFRNHIVPITDVPALVQEFKSYGCYATYFFYSDELLTYMSAQSGSPTVSGYEGKVWAPYLPIDLDHAELTPALMAARQLSDYFVDRWQIDPNGLQIYFSGLKGFHLLLDSRIFRRLAPARGLPALFDALRRHLAQEIAEPFRATIDLSIKDRMRLLRLPNTIHEKSKLFKIQLTREELRAFDASQIRELAKKPRRLYATDETDIVPRVQVKPNDAAVQLCQRIQRQLKKLTRKPFVYRFHRPDDLSQLQFPCAGAQAIWENHIEAGQRNNCAIRLASELRQLGLSAEETAQKLLEWNERKEIELPVDELRSVVRSAYQHRFPYRYSCREDILRRFCPLRDDEACRKFVASRAISQQQPAFERRNTKRDAG